MNAYITLEVIVLCFAFFGESFNQLNGIQKKFSSSRLYIGVVFLLLTLFMGLRGDFTTDYNTYKYIFEQMKQSSLSAVFQDDEFLFKFLYYILGKLNADAVTSFVVIAAITTWGYLKFFKEYSPIVWMSVLMLLCVGAFFTGANAMRNILAASLYCLTWRYAERGDFKRYCITTVIVSLIHLSAILLIPVYFVFRIRWNKRYFKIVLTAFIAVMIVTATFADKLANFGMNFIYQNYDYGVDSGLTWVSVFKVIVIQLFILFYTKKLNLDDARERCLYNVSLLYTMFYLCAMNMMILQRFAYYYGTAHLVIVPLIISRIRNKRERALVCVGMVCFLMLYSWLALKNTEYYFFWN